MPRYFKYELEFQPSVGTTRLQPLSIREMSFVIDPYIFNSGMPLNSYAGCPSAPGEFKIEIAEMMEESDDANDGIDDGLL